MATIQDLSVELLECVLSQLSMPELLLSQRVCRDWRDVIKTSPQLQRNMFLGFVPSNITNPEQMARFVHDNSRCATTPRKATKSSRRLSKIIEQKRTSSEQAEGQFVARFNPVFPSEGDIIRTRTKHFRESLQSSQSWLDMFITSPPCNYAEATVFFIRPPSMSFRRLTRRASDVETAIVRVSRAKGVRARDVLQEVYDAHIAKARKWQRIDIHVPGVVHA